MNQQKETITLNQPKRLYKLLVIPKVPCKKCGNTIYLEYLDMPNIIKCKVCYDSEK